ncbi:serine hydrolase domain-containing protein [Flagellimonas crocea]|uniref:serine hydrolase domain-containing protein n=1 Tax=Flagellimonas crocea TaxID=3067311 RepID=UPI00296F3FBF|nr:serine hydrolase domain-containing protein [Muricauda sp. DH64]
MKNTSLSLTIFISFFINSCAVSEDEIVNASVYDCTMPVEAIGQDHPKHNQYQAILEHMVSNGVPGVMMTVYDAKEQDGPWSGASGMADLKNRVEMKNCNITRVGSTVKMFTAVTILQLVEEGKLHLDDKAEQYLSPGTMANIENAHQATVGQLMQHSSGIYNYIVNPRFQTASLNDPLKEWQPDELLSYARGKSANFKVGTDVDYSNTNYIFLGEIIETIEGKPFYKVFEERIFEPLQLTFTNFAAENPVPKNIVRGYIDLYSKLEVTESTYYSGWDYYTADGGLISNPYDLFLFLSAVINKTIISEKSFESMTDWKSPSNDDETFYGMGIFKMKTKFGDAYIHSGDAIGYAASMIYLPQADVFACWAVNGNYGKIDEHSQSLEAIELIIEKITQ